MSDYGVFEASTTDGHEEEQQQRQAQRDLGRAIEAAREGFGDFLAGATDKDDYTDRLALVMNDLMQKVADSGVMPVPGVMRKVKAALRPQFKQAVSDWSTASDDEVIQGANLIMKGMEGNDYTDETFADFQEVLKELGRRGLVGDPRVTGSRKQASGSWKEVNPRSEGLHPDNAVWKIQGPNGLSGTVIDELKSGTDSDWFIFGPNGPILNRKFGEPPLTVDEAKKLVEDHINSGTLASRKQASVEDLRSYVESKGLTTSDKDNGFTFPTADGAKGHIYENRAGDIVVQTLIGGSGGGVQSNYSQDETELVKEWIDRTASRTAGPGDGNGMKSEEELSHLFDDDGNEDNGDNFKSSGHKTAHNYEDIADRAADDYAWDTGGDPWTEPNFITQYLPAWASANAPDIAFDPALYGELENEALMQGYGYTIEGKRKVANDYEEIADRAADDFERETGMDPYTNPSFITQYLPAWASAKVPNIAFDPALYEELEMEANMLGYGYTVESSLKEADDYVKGDALNFINHLQNGGYRMPKDAGYPGEGGQMDDELYDYTNGDQNRISEISRFLQENWDFYAYGASRKTADAYGELIDFLGPNNLGDEEPSIDEVRDFLDDADTKFSPQKVNEFAKQLEEELGYDLAEYRSASRKTADLSSTLADDNYGVIDFFWDTFGHEGLNEDAPAVEQWDWIKDHFGNSEIVEGINDILALGGYITQADADALLGDLGITASRKTAGLEWDTEEENYWSYTSPDSGLDYWIKKDPADYNNYYGGFAWSVFDYLAGEGDRGNAQSFDEAEQSIEDFIDSQSPNAALDYLGSRKTASKCPKCDGMGRETYEKENGSLSTQTCKACGGTGTTKESRRKEALDIDGKWEEELPGIGYASCTPKAGGGFELYMWSDTMQSEALDVVGTSEEARRVWQEWRRSDIGPSNAFNTDDNYFLGHVKHAGGTDFATFAEGSSAQEAFNNAKAEAKRMYGDDGYTGSIAEKDSFEMASRTPMSEEEARKFIWNGDGFGKFEDKWGPAGCIELDTGGFVFFGVAST